MTWKLYVRTKQEGACRPGLWIFEGGMKRTILDTGAMRAWPLSQQDAEHIVRAVNNEEIAQIREAKYRGILGRILNVAQNEQFAYLQKHIESEVQVGIAFLDDDDDEAKDGD